VINEMPDSLLQLLQAVQDEKTLLLFVTALAADRASVEHLPQTPDGFQGGWANCSISMFLDAAVSWAEDSNFGARPGPKPQNPWSTFAMFLYAGRGYE
jgi:hypothetical protein